MEKRDTSQFQPVGVCYRLFNFIVNTVIGQGLKRITLGRPVSRGSIEVPVEGSSLSNGVNSIEETHIYSTKPNEEEMLQPHPVNEIIVEFRHNNGLEYWTTPIENLDSLVNGTDKLQKGNDDLKYKERENKERDIDRASESPLIQEIGHVPNNGISISQVEAKGPKDAEKEEQNFSTSIGARAKGLKKNGSSIKASANHEKEKNRKKEKKIATERLTLAIEPEQVQPEPTRHHHRPLLSVLTNINEKSDEFIRKTKDAMRSNYYSDSEPKSS